MILEPSAVLDLVGFLFYDFAGTSMADQRSCFNKRMGKRVMGENITLHDDAYHPLQSGAPFDGEGIPRQKVLLVDKGVPSNLVYSRATAKKMKAKPTGHGFSLPNDMGEAPMNLVFGGGDSSVDEMVRSTERGILVTRALVHSRSRSLRKSAHRNDARRHVLGSGRHASPAAFEISVSTRASSKCFRTSR